MSGLRFGLSLSMQGRDGKAWKPSDIFLPGDNGFLYDFSLADTLFQEATGITPAGVDQNVGLALDVSKWGGKTLAQVLAGQPELSANPGGPFTVTTGWANTGGSHAVVGGNLEITRGAGTTYDAQQQTHISGATLQIELDVAANAGTASIRVGSVAGNNEDLNIAFTGTGLKKWIVRTGGANRYVSILAPGTLGDTVSIARFSAKVIPGNHASQATSGARPVLKAGGLTRYDGSDDNLLTTLNPTAELTLFAKVKIPSTLSTTQVIIGGNTSILPRAFISASTTGQLCAGVGNQNNAVILAANDLRGLTLCVGMVVGGGRVKLLENDTVVYDNAGDGSPASSNPLRLGASSPSGVAANWFGGDIYQALAINRALTPAEVLKLTNAWSH